MSALKAFLIVLAASVLNFLIGVIPDILFELFDWISRIFGANTPFGSLKAIGKIDQIFNFFSWLVSTGKAILLVALAFLACGIKTIKIPFIENLIEKYASKDKEYAALIRGSYVSGVRRPVQGADPFFAENPGTGPGNRRAGEKRFANHGIRGYIRGRNIIL